MRFPRSIVMMSLLLGCTTGSGASRQAPAPAAVATLGPGTPLTATQRHWIDSTLGTLALRERVGQMVMVWVLGDYTSTSDSTFVEVARWIQEDGIGGVSMSLGSPMEVATKVNAFQRLARVPLLVSADLEPDLGRLEGGVFTHYLMDAGSATVFPTAMAIAATGREQDAWNAGNIIGKEARAVGIHVNFAPVVDVNNNPANPVINTRSFGEDPGRVARLAALFVKGSQDAGTLATAKHFPGHGDTDVDSHVGLPVVRSDWQRLATTELVPFRAAIDAGVSLVMSAHIALPALAGDSTTPATLSSGIMTGILRDTLDFRGLVITDAMTMEGVGKGYGVEESSVLAVKAGADIILKPGDVRRAIDAVVTAVENGEIPASRIEQSVRRVLELKARSGVAFQRTVSPAALRDVVGAADHRAVAADIARRALTLLRDGGAIPVGNGSLLVIQYLPETELRAGRVFAAALRKSVPGARIVRIGPAVSREQLDSLSRQAGEAGRVVLAAHVRRIEGEGRPAMPPLIAQWMDSLAAAAPGRVALVAYGNPYLVRQVPSVKTYLVTWSVGDDSERAAADALLGRLSITGVSPVSLPGFFTAGDGIRRQAASPPDFRK